MAGILQVELTKNQILRQLAEHSGELRRFSVITLGLFGSFVRGEAKIDSDMDFLVSFNNKTYRNYIGLKFYLEELFNHKVDLVIADNIKPRLQEIILSEVAYVPGFDNLS